MIEPHTFIAPMLAVRVPHPFDDVHWWYEIKWDGYRCQIHWTDHLQIFSRNGQSLLRQFPDLADVAKELDRPVILDGELIAWENGKPSFSALQRRHGGAHRVIVFDCLYAEGEWLLAKPLKTRLEYLHNVVSTQGKIVVADGVVEHGMALWTAAWDHGLEGVMAKNLNSPYLPGKRVRAWQKFLVMNRQWAVVSVISRALDGQWMWWVSSDKDGGDVMAKLLAPKDWNVEVSLLVKEKRGTDIIWRLPDPIDVEVEYRELTAEGKMRHGRIRQWRTSN
ncbi:RNA ligase family protein [Sulfobacillus thermosulfidooxidans]|uniref:ATP-dependent DNA ligase n=1 Tax=Sulfobacillus thermosulfidooxidans TaxID=28034 RepID=UPI0006B417DC|nr:RNA ligase family protein [Sulfobacillus thermosulfidooxidans]